jgi:hypothetical protein
MLQLLGSHSLLPACILGRVEAVFAVLVTALPSTHVFALLGRTAVAAGLVVARLRRDMAGLKPAARVRAKA